MAKIQVRTVTYDVEAGNLYSDTPPGLLISLGDGSARERSAEDLARAMCVGKDPNEMIRVIHYKVGEDGGKPRVVPRWKLELPKAKTIIAALIQQAQENGK